MKTDCRKEALEKIRRDFTSYHATAKKGSRYPLYLRQMVREAARKGIQKERLVEASGVPGYTVSRWLPRRSRRKGVEEGFTELQIIDRSSADPSQLSSTCVLTYPSGIVLELPVGVLSPKMLSDLGVLPS
jgi:hypothetical protein